MLRVKVDGIWVDSLAPTSVVEWQTVPEGLDQATFTSTPGLPILRNRAVAELFDDGAAIGTGILAEPNGDTYTIQGAWTEVERFAALDGSSAPTTDIDTAIDVAIGKGLMWAGRDAAMSAWTLSTNTFGDVLALRTVIEAWANAHEVRWTVDPHGYATSYATPASPTLMTLGEFRLGTADDDYVSHLSGIRLNSTGDKVPVPEVGFPIPAELWGYSSQVVDLTELGYITEAMAQDILGGMRRRGRHRQALTGSIVVTDGQLATIGGLPVDLSTVRAGRDRVRMQRAWDTTQDTVGHNYLDFTIGRTIHRPQERTLELQPIALAARNFTAITREVKRRATHRLRQRLT